MRRNRQISRVMLFMLCGLALVLSGNQATAQTGTWTTKAPMPTARTEHVVGVINGVLYAVGGDLAADVHVTTVEAYNRITNTWTTKAPMPTARGQMAAGVVNNILYVAGGQVANNCAPINTNEAYDTATDSWTTKAPMPTARWLFAAGAVNGIIYFVGGQPGCGGQFSTVEAYDPATNSWTTKAPMPTARYGLSVSVVNGILYAVGGFNPNPVATVEAYDPVANTWSTKTSMSSARGFLATGVLDGLLYAVGGQDNLPPDGLAEVSEAYNPMTNTWSTKPSMPTPRVLPAAGVVDGVLYVVGGRVPSGVAVATNEAFTPVIMVQIDIKPSSFPNAIPDTDTINLTAQGTLPVAIFTTADFDAATVDASTVVFAGAPTVRSALEDVDGDSDLDLVLHFDNQALSLACADTQATLDGQAASGTSIHGTDSIRVLKDKAGNKCP